MLPRRVRPSRSPPLRPGVRPPCLADYTRPYPRSREHEGRVSVSCLSALIGNFIRGQTPQSIGGSGYSPRIIAGRRTAMRRGANSSPDCSISVRCHQRCPMIYPSAFTGMTDGFVALAVKKRSYWSWRRPCQSKTCRRVQTQRRIGRTSPVSSCSSRRAAASNVSPGRSPPPGATHQRLSPGGSCASRSKSRFSSSNNRTRAAARAPSGIETCMVFFESV
jgi:hypothetical protein